MIAVSLVLIYLGIARRFEPLLLVPIGFGGILANVSASGIVDPGGILYQIYQVGIDSGAFPLIIFLGLGALTDFGPVIANPKTLLLGAAAQFGIFTTLAGAVFLTELGWLAFTPKEAAAISIIGGADGPTAIYLASRLAPDILASIAVAAYSYMALVPILQPPVMKLLTSAKERAMTMPATAPTKAAGEAFFPVFNPRPSRRFGAKGAAPSRHVLLWQFASRIRRYGEVAKGGGRRCHRYGNYFFRPSRRFKAIGRDLFDPRDHRHTFFRRLRLCNWHRLWHFDGQADEPL